MALKDLLAITTKRATAARGVTEERVIKNVEDLRKMVAFWREYPDYFIDFIKGPNSTFKLFFYQRLFLRVILRYRFVFAVFPRAWSKSFLSILGLMIRCVLYPNARLFITAGGKEQAATITRAKVEEVCRLLPFFDNEIERASYTKDDVRVSFKNGSHIKNLAANERSRGLRYHAGLFEECIKIDPEMLNEVLIPVMNISRYVNGVFYPEEVLNKSQVYLTTAGWKNTFAYEKLIEMLVYQILNPKEAFILGGTWRIPVLEKLLDRNFVRDLKRDGTYNEASFEREFESIWSGDSQNAFFSSEKFEKHRVLKLAEDKYSGRSSKNAYYIISVDVGRKGDTTEIVVIKVTPQLQGGSALKSVVNIYTHEAEHFEKQAIHIKKLFYQYKCKVAAVDAKGLGLGLMDFLVISQTDEEGTYYPSFGVVNDTDNTYKEFIVDDTERDAIYLIKADSQLNTDAHSYVQTQMASGKIKFLVDEGQAKTRLMSTERGRKMTPEERAEYLKPYVLTTILKEQMMNLVEENEGQHIVLKQANRGIKKDKFSAFEYGLYYIREQELKERKRKKRNISDFMFFTPNK